MQTAQKVKHKKWSNDNSYSLQLRLMWVILTSGISFFLKNIVTSSLFYKKKKQNKSIWLTVVLLHLPEKSPLQLNLELTHGHCILHLFVKLLTRILSSTERLFFTSYFALLSSVFFEITEGRCWTPHGIFISEAEQLKCQNTGSGHCGQEKIKALNVSFNPTLG